MKALICISRITPGWKFIFLLFLSFNCNAQKFGSIFCDFSGSQPVVIDTNGVNGRTPLISGKAKNQLGFGVKLMEMNANRSLHLGLIFSYRQVNLSNLQTTYEKKKVYEFLAGVTFLPAKSLINSEKTAVHFSLSTYFGIQNNALGSNLSGGFMFLSKKGVSGLTLEFVYRPFDYEYANNSDVLVHEPYFIKLDPSWAIRAAITFGKYLSYSSN
jgi:hypothetical protein